MVVWSVSSGKNSLANDNERKKFLPFALTKGKFSFRSRVCAHSGLQGYPQERNITKKEYFKEKEKRAKALKRKNFAELSSSAANEAKKPQKLAKLEKNANLEGKSEK